MKLTPKPIQDYKDSIITATGKTHVLTNTDINVYQPLETFDIRNFLDNLTPAKEKNKYICPVCEGHNLSIDINTGEYQCWNGCECRNIREAIKPWSEVLEERKHSKYTSHPKVTPIRRKAKNLQPAPISTDNISIGILPNPVTALETIMVGENLITKYPYSSTQWVNRTDKPNEDKITIPYHINNKGETVKGKGKSSDDWQPYRFDEICQYGAGKWVLGVEGEKCTDIARFVYQLLTFTFQGGSWGEKVLFQYFQSLKDAGVAGIIYWPDHDDTGYSKAKKCGEAAAKVGLPFVVIDPLTIFPECPEKGDIADFANIVAMNGDELASLLQNQIREAAQQQTEQAQEEFDDIPPGKERKKLGFSQLALEALYMDTPWICAGDKLYKWVGNHYQLVPECIERRRIADFCDSYVVWKREENNTLVATYPYAKPSRIDEAIKWAKSKLSVKLDSLNPSGLNCLNGILQITWDGNKPSWQLVAHHPSYYYTYAPLIEYNPNADPGDCDRLLNVLDAPQREIFLKVIAASLDLPNVRRLKGRLIRALLLKGTGSNGKDALREAIATIYGKQGITSATLTDFAQYDAGRKFPLRKLIYSRINWASENTNSTKLDKIQSLKAFVTGNPLDSEGKGKDDEEFTPNAICLFNINDVPNIQGSLEAILSRNAVIDFNKTFKIGADPSKGELEADPRFAYDPMFLRLMVCPALLNRLLDALKDLMINGIDYSCTQQTLEDIQVENSHLFQFIQDTELNYDPNDYLSASDIWTRLEQWYLDNGTLTYEETKNGKQKAIWQEQVKASDKNVKAVNQVIARFKQLFPKAKLVTVPHPSGKRNMQVLQGVSFGSIVNKQNYIAINENSKPDTQQLPHQESLVNQDFHTNHTSFNNFVETENQENDLTFSQQCETEFNEEKKKEEKLVCDQHKSCTASISGVQSGVIGDVADDLIARENSLLRIETENISTDDSHTIAEVPIPKLQSETTSTKIISADSQLESSINSDSGSY
ncbi:bacteriophage DNA primase/helicase (plasmid) [Anabaena sp. 90]|uniref:DUF5906 domain-containing protein n=1 Tax=Anabaena sp. 90 TaxID=46234 RepID=UPI00029B74AC|nr:DUF5906 domain-containing protein [Anabaena sp. 90]AFW97282.1 bacteriophage DNA primase/helicase [Anabaena sp. 90]